jgi:hypothetical protein
MTENPLAKVIDRLMRMAEMHGTVYCRITWNPDGDEFFFTPLLKEFVEVNFEGKKHD